ncbi:hypothetical protein [Sphingomonas sp.]|uniref:hypothetical protein n=1 Tax=Sphingomonas sp. TaxID=28214 RepID=UPI001B2D2738|nr:hypothetical protein [Sphingomonas sp.]MBO9712173.1 hypothetical protein [Sphingomonas sp.]
MIFVFIAGILGFLVFDAYRVRKIYDATGALIITFTSRLGMAVHGVVYLAAGVLAVAINLDVVVHWNFLSAPPDQILGPLTRGFALGLAGPAGLSKGTLPKETGANTPKKAARRDLGTLEAAAPVGRRARAYLDFLLLRNEM